MTPLGIGLLITIATACGGPGDQSAQNGSNEALPSDANGATLPCEETGAVDLNGTFAVYARLGMRFLSRPGGAIVVCPSDQTNAGGFVAIFRVTPGEGARPDVEARVCNVELPVVSAALGSCREDATNFVYGNLEVPPALLDAFPVASVGRATAQLDGASPGAPFSFDPMSFRLGTRLSSSDSPTWQSELSGCGTQDVTAGRTCACDDRCVTDCAALSDDDHDGWPGVTVNVCGYTHDDESTGVLCHPEDPSVPGASVQGRIGVTLQVEPTFTGSVVSSCELRGDVNARVSYGVVGGDVYVANAQISVTSALRSLPLYEVLPEDSKFRAIRIDGKHGSEDWGADLDEPLEACRAVLSRQNELH